MRRWLRCWVVLGHLEQQESVRDCNPSYSRREVAPVYLQFYGLAFGILGFWFLLFFASFSSVGEWGSGRDDCLESKFWESMQDMSYPQHL